MIKVPGPWMVDQLGVRFRLMAEMNNPTHEEFQGVQEWLTLVGENLLKEWGIKIEDD